MKKTYQFKKSFMATWPASHN